jgi:hypothetical protein
MNHYKQLEQVREFMTQFNQWTPASDETRPDNLDLNRYAMYMEEVLEAMRATNDVERLDAAIDIWYVALGREIELGRLAIGQVWIGAHTVNATSWLTLFRNTLSNSSWNSVDWIESVATVITKYLNHREQIPLRAFELGFDEVHKNNMNKQWDRFLVNKHLAPIDAKAFESPNGKYVVKSNLGKIIKPPGYAKPDLATILEKVLSGTIG